MEKVLELELQKDDMRVAGQNYAVVSFISPISPQKFDKLAMKIKGVFNTLDEARDYGKKLHRADDTYDLHVVEMYSWLLIPPSRENNGLGEVHYSEQKLHELINEHDKQQETAKIEFEKYKREQIELGKKQALENKLKEENENKIKEEAENEIKDEPVITE